MKLVYKPIVLKQLKNLPKTELKKIFRKTKLVATNPNIGKPLKGRLEHFHSLKAWPYRIIYQHTKTTITIYSISHRQSAYK